MKYKVIVKRIAYSVKEVIFVEANSVEEAEEQAYYTISEDVEIVSVEAVE